MELASALRKQPCSCDASKPRMAGSLNWAVFLKFNDGVVWVFRAPHAGRRTILSDEYSFQMIMSEVATLNYVSANSSIPVPEVFAYR